uniref:Transcriptional regulator, AsnC family n=1 Tax=Caulobacter sp. (strain K31) TaxID=366602 RepID=B0T9J4_CAUSK
MARRPVSLQSEDGLSPQEAAILRLLQQDARMTTASIAEQVHMSATPCWRAIKRLEEIGVIEAYRVSVNRQALGYGVDAIVIVQIDSHRDADAGEFEAAVAREPMIVECAVVSGPADYHLRVVASDIESFSNFSRRVIAKLPHVREVRTSFVMREIKKFTGLPVQGR